MALTDNLIAHYKMDAASGGETDVHGNNDLTDNNTVGSGTGKLDGARDFEASNNESLHCTDNADLSTGDIDWTVACWVNIESITTGTIVQKAAVSDLEYELRLMNSAGGLFNLRVSSGFNFANLTSVSATKFGNPSLATWYFLVAWHDSVNNTINIQINNGTVDSASYTHGTYNSSAEFRIGSYAVYSEAFDGLIDSVSFWKRLLTADERTQLYNSGNGLDYDDWGGGGSPATTGHHLLLLGVG